MHSKWACWTPVTNIKLCNNQKASTSPRDTFNQGETVFAVYKIFRKYLFLELSLQIFWF